MGQDPEELRAQIARTREELGQDLDVLAEKVTPSKVVERRVDATKEKVAGVKDRIMGSATTARDSVMGTVSDGAASGASAGASVGSSVSGGASSAVHAVGDRATTAAHLAQQAPGQAKAKAAGNPFAAGIVAFGVGWLVSGLIPASTAEKRGAGKLKEAAQSVAEPVKQSLTSVAAEVKDNLQPAVTEAVSSVKETATDAAGTVKEQATGAAADVKEQATGAATTVADTAREKAADVKDTATSGGSPEPVGAVPVLSDPVLTDPVVTETVVTDVPPYPVAGEQRLH